MAEIAIIPESIRLVRLTDEEYFSTDYKEYISNSKLGLLNPDEGGSIEKYLAGYSGDYSDSFELGSAVHAMVLQRNNYDVSNIRKPSGKLGLFADHVFRLEKKGVPRENAIAEASISANYYANKLTDKRLTAALEACEPYWESRKAFEESPAFETARSQIYLSSALASKYEMCMAGIENNPEVYNTLYPKSILGDVEVYNEFALFAEVDVTIDGKTTRLKLKSKLDNFTVNHETQELTLNDLKTTGKPVNFFMGNNVRVKDENGNNTTVWYDGSFQKFHYYRQMGMYLWILACYFKHNLINYRLKANMVVVETIPDFKTRIYKVNNKHIKQGLDEFKKLLILVANG